MPANISASVNRPDSAAWAIRLLFDAGTRPTLAVLQDSVESLASLSISMSGDDFADSSLHWAGLVWNGLSFDLVGLSPGRATDIRLRAENLQAEKGASVTELPAYEAVDIYLGSHLAGAENSIPIVKALWNMVAGLTGALADCEMVIWQPSSTTISPLEFRKLASAWTDQSSLPVNGLIRFEDEIDRGIRTQGMAFFTGQELRLEPELTADRDWARRLGARLADAMIMRGNLSAAEDFAGPDGGKLRLAPSENGKFVRVWRG